MNTKMSLHRVIAEIKAAEEQVGILQSSNFAGFLQGKEDEYTDAFKKQAQGAFDKILALSRNIVTLKTARNKANAEVVLTINTKEYTIDKALARKATLHIEEQLISNTKAQYEHARKHVEACNTKLEQTIQQQLTTIFTGKQATPEEIKIVRDAAEEKQKMQTLTFDGFDSKIKALEEDISKFKLEIDYSLSEANATNFVEVDLT